MHNISTVPPFENIFSMESLLQSWQEFIRGKKTKVDVAEFSMHLFSNLEKLHLDIKRGVYRHGPYKHFVITDPKRRDIHKASVRDRVLHHALYRGLYPYFDQKFIHDSFSCRIDKGTHRALKRFNSFALKASRNNKKTLWVLKCDIKKCFASIDHTFLKNILQSHVFCPKTYTIVENVIDSFEKGIPLGNLTSQLFINMYLNELDQQMKRTFHVKHYIRYADDFVIMSTDKDVLLELVPKIADFLEEYNKLLLHPDKVYLKTWASGVDFLGWIHFPHHKVLRTAMKKKIKWVFRKNPSRATEASYRGMLSHGNAHEFSSHLVI